jgi:hypothetical protein
MGKCERTVEGILGSSRCTGDGVIIIDGGGAAFLGVMPSGRKVLAAVGRTSTGNACQIQDGSARYPNLSPAACGSLS